MSDTEARAALREARPAAHNTIDFGQPPKAPFLVVYSDRGDTKTIRDAVMEAIRAALPDDGRVDRRELLAKVEGLAEEVRAMLDTHACFQTDPPLIGVIELRRRLEATLAALPDDSREAATFPLDLEAFVAGLDSPNHSDESRRDWCRLFFRDMQRAAALPDDGREGLNVERLAEAIVIHNLGYDDGIRNPGDIEDAESIARQYAAITDKASEERS